MAKEVNFNGFSKGTVEFFLNLKRNNNKNWFDQNKDKFDNLVMKPARFFVEALGEKLQSISPGIVADPKVNKSIFRIYRDTRFSLDKSPYKIHLGLYFWEGGRPKLECSGFYFHLEPPRLTLGVGVYIFPKHRLHQFRSAVVGPDHGDGLADIIGKILKDSRYELGGRHYKRMPPGYDDQHANAGLLLHNGLYVGLDTDIPEELYTPRLVDYCMKVFADLYPLHEWLVAFSERMSGR